MQDASSVRVASVGGIELKVALTHVLQGTGKLLGTRGQVAWEKTARTMACVEKPGRIRTTFAALIIVTLPERSSLDKVTLK